ISYFFLITHFGLAQNDTPLIERKGNLVQNHYFILGKGVSERQVLKKMKPYEVAHDRMKSSRRWAFTSSVIAGLGAGAFMPSIFDPSPKITLASLITGASLIAIAVPFKRLANRKADEAIELYNSRQLMVNPKNKLSFNLIFDQQGIGLNMKF
ncbi:hypothetical protein, partial [Marivirga sp.]|uniref:hypothetical protein n=1 Tax=Marivirga sp. TaxID=2018662 RepID=UPI0025E9B83E